MKKLILILMVGSLFAQNLPPQSDIEKMTATEKMMLYNMNQQNPTSNMLASWLVPTLGHYKTGNWKRGATIYFGGLLISFGAGLGLDYMIEQDGDVTSDDGLFIGWIGGAIISNIWQVADAGIQTKRYNRRLYKSIFGQEPSSIGFKLQPTCQGATLTMSYAFN